ncbi:MAG: dCTP deaminase, partial [Thermoplasmata archaeon]|nr:dCTP deaminase [Thermoplasmata archaeon]
MAVLSDTDILEHLANGSLKIEGFVERNLTPNGYDVTIEEIWIPSTDARFKEGTATIPGGRWFV